MLYCTTYIIINKTLIKAKKKTKKKHITYNNPLKSIVVRPLVEQYLIQK